MGSRTNMQLYRIRYYRRLWGIVRSFIGARDMTSDEADLHLSELRQQPPPWLVRATKELIP